MCVLSLPPSLTPAPWQQLIFFMSPVLPFLEYCIIGILQYVAFSDWLLSLSNMHLSFFHVFSWLDSSFLFFLVDHWTLLRYNH